MILLRPICWIKGHKRGKALPGWPRDQFGDVLWKNFACPRCGRETRYKAKDQSKGTSGEEA